MKPDKVQIRRMSRKAYVDPIRGITKVILGKDEWQIEFKLIDAFDAKRKIPAGEYSLNDIVPAEIDENVLRIREECARLSAEIVSIYGDADRLGGFYIYDRDVRLKTDMLAYEMMQIKKNGIR